MQKLTAKEVRKHKETIREELDRIGKLLKVAKEYAQKGKYAPLGGALLYIAKAANTAKRSCGPLMWKYLR